MSEQTVSPLTGVGIQTTVERGLANRLGVNHVSHPWETRQTLRALNQISAHKL